MALQLQKYFVGGIAPETTEDDMRNYFGQFGEIIDVAVMRDQFGLPRCFGFVQFADAYSHTCRPTDEHVIVGKKVDVKAAVPKDAIDQGAQIRTNKIFVGGLSKASTADSVRAHFQGFGNVTEVLMKFNEMGESRGFCFVEFDSEDAAEMAVNTPGQFVDGKDVECKLARPLGDRMLGKGFGKGGKGDFGKGGYGMGMMMMGKGKGGPMRTDFFGKGARPAPYGVPAGRGFGAAGGAAYGAGFGKGAATFGAGRGAAPAYGGKGAAAGYSAGGYSAAPAASYGGYGAAAAAPAYGAAASTGGYGGYAGGGYAAAPAAAPSYGGYGGYSQGY